MIKTKNKKIAKVSFFLFLFFSFFALGFTICNSVSAYTSADMPVGYRPITYEDQGKVFGVDLDTTIYFDTSVSIPSVFRYDLYLSDNIINYYFTASYETFSFWNRDNVEIPIYDNLAWNLIEYSADINDVVNFESEEVASTYSTFFYVKDYVEEIPIIESILSLFNKLVIWIPSAITGLIALFYSIENGLTFLGALAVAGLAISVIFLLIGIIQNFLHFGG